MWDFPISNDDQLEKVDNFCWKTLVTKSDTMLSLTEVVLYIAFETKVTLVYRKT